MSRWIAFAFALLLCAPALAFERHVERLVATPTPVGPLLLARDDAGWRVEIPPETIVFVDARGDPTTPFLLRATREGATQSSLALPTTRAGFVLATPGAWIVNVDPLVGVAVDIEVHLRGYVTDEGGAPATFTLTDAPTRTDCIVPGVCLA